MEAKNNPISIVELIMMRVTSADHILVCILVCWILKLHDLYSYVLQFILDFFFYTGKSLARVMDFEAEIVTPTSTSTSTNGRMLRGEVEMAMARLGLICDSQGDELSETFGLYEVESLFCEEEPSIEEVKQAFDLFDENCDGYIDEKEIEKVLCKLGLTQFSQEECQMMIASYDVNKDGRIDFSEYSKLVEDSFC